MSDLAPLVGAALRDKVVMELSDELEQVKNENTSLQSSLEQSLARMIRITGPGGFPVYAERNYYEIALNELDRGVHQLNLFNSTALGGSNCLANPYLATCCIEDILECELHIGTKEVVKFSTHKEVYYPYEEDADIEFELQIEPRRRWFTVDFPREPFPRSWREQGGYVMIDFFTCEEIGEDPRFQLEDFRNEEVDFVRFDYVACCNDPFDETD